MGKEVSNLVPPHINNYPYRSTTENYTNFSPINFKSDKSFRRFFVMSLRLCQ